MLKKIICILLSFVCITAICLPASAVTSIDIISPCYVYALKASSSIYNSNGIIECKSKLTGSVSVTKISATQYLEKKSGNKWATVSGGVWSDTQSGSTFSMSNSKSNLDSGTYRLRTVFTVYSGTKSETVTKTSTEVTI